MVCNNLTIISADQGRCSKGLYGGEPGNGTCLHCPHNTDPAWHKAQIQANRLKEAADRSIQINIVPLQQVVVPRSQWPLWARGLALVAVPTDGGLGDVLERLLGVPGERWKRWWLKRGADCGCAGRQDWMNQRYPLH